MKQLEVTITIKECSECPYTNIWGLYCNKSKRKIPDMNEDGHYIIPKWCELTKLDNTIQFTPELINCGLISGHGIGISCEYADKKSAIVLNNPKTIKFKCKWYNINIAR